MTAPIDGNHTANPQPVSRVWISSFYNGTTSKMIGFDWAPPGKRKAEAVINFGMDLADLDVICNAKLAPSYLGAILGDMWQFFKGFPSRESDHTAIFSSFHALELVMGARISEISPEIIKHSKLGYPVEITMDLTGRILEQSYNPTYSIRKRGV